MTIIHFVVIAIIVLLFFWTKNNMKTIKNIREKIKIITLVILGVFIVTIITFQISKIGINYPNDNIYMEMKKVTIMLFLPINSLIALPQIAKVLEDVRDKDIDRDKIKKRIIIIGILIIIAIIFEIGYLKDFQNGIIQLLNK